MKTKINEDKQRTFHEGLDGGGVGFWNSFSIKDLAHYSLSLKILVYPFKRITLFF